MTFRISNYKVLKPFRYFITSALLTIGLGSYLELNGNFKLPNKPIDMQRIERLEYLSRNRWYFQSQLEEIRTQGRSVDSIIDNLKSEREKMKTSVENSLEYANYNKNLEKAKEKRKTPINTLIGLGFLSYSILLTESYLAGNERRKKQNATKRI